MENLFSGFQKETLYIIESEFMAHLTSWRRELLEFFHHNPDFYKSLFWEEKLPSPSLKFIVQDIIKRQGTLKYLVEHLGKPSHSMDPIIYYGLLLGMYQLVFCPEIPPYAVVHETVEIVKKRKNQKSASFVNAILRKTERKMAGVRPLGGSKKSSAIPFDSTREIVFKEPIFPSPEKNLNDYLKHAYSYPLWIIERFSKSFSQEKMEEILLEGNLWPPLFARINPLQGSLEEIQAELTAQSIAFSPTSLPEVVRMDKGISISDLSLYQEGKIYFQDLSTARILSGWDWGKPSRVLDLCAAPGGKLCALASQLPSSTEFVGVDVSSVRLEKMRENLNRLGVSALLIEADGRELSLSSLGVFDLLILDVPCSNSGVLRRRPEARWRVREEDLKNLVSLQSDLLQKGSSFVSPGGHLFYSTCSILKEENQTLVQSFLQKNPSFHVVGEKQILPGEEGGDGAYGALLNKMN